MSTPGGGNVDLDAYHAARSIDHQPFRSACYAPFVGLSFDMTGAVSVCAFTRATPLGRVGEVPLLEMWQGSRISDLRAAVARDDLHHACSRCAEEIAGGNLHGVLAAGFDQFPASRHAEWPTRMEFALSNTCNLQCVMCSGEFSSAIRSQREGLPPLPQRYGEEFLDELTPFLPHLEQARFLGGEPFLAEINFRIWERMIELGLQIDCNVTTNGTQWTPRVERVLEHLPFSIGISIDGVTRETVERVRAGADHGRVMENLGRFVEYRDRRGTSLSLTFCLMRQNWHEFVDYLVMADAIGCEVYVNTVRQPPEHSLYELPTEELHRIVERLELDAAAARDRLRVNLHALDEQLSRLRAQLALRHQQPEAFAADTGRRARHQALLDELGELTDDEASLVARLRRAAVDEVVSVVRCDADDLVVEGNEYIGLDVSALVGAPASVLHPRLAELLGHRVDVLADRMGDGLSARVITFAEPDAAPWVIATMTVRGPSPWTTSRIAALLAVGERRATTVELRREG
jgi:MoaA/NifB/PqqE/SkfB family radical SAM enzyme